MQFDHAHQEFFSAVEFVQVGHIRKITNRRKMPKLFYGSGGSGKSQTYFTAPELQESLRKWFAKRTDREELKKKPVYPADDKFKLDNRISKVREMGMIALLDEFLWTCPSWFIPHFPREHKVN